MKSPTYKNRLQKLSEKLINLPEPFDYAQLMQSIQEMKLLFEELSDIELNDEENRKDIHLNNGKAIGMTWAAMCVEDIMRTTKFIRGIYKAVRKMQKQKEGTVQILYAGTGPYATLVLPLTAFFSSEEVQFTLLEINPQSLQHLRQVVEKVELQDYVKAYKNCDATTYQIEKDADILISETMQRALEKELQVPIFFNLIPQLPAHALIIPEKIELHASLYSSRNREKEMLAPDSASEPSHRKLGCFFSLDRSTIDKYSQDYQNQKTVYHFPASHFEIPKEKNYDKLAVLTEIQIFADEYLNAYQSGLTIPLILDNISPEHWGKSLTINYNSKYMQEINYQIEEVSANLQS